MRSIKTIYKIGNGPSSSHTVGPYCAAQLCLKTYPEADEFKVILFGSLAFTGDGHGTGKSIKSVMPNAEIIRNTKETDLPHPNTMDFLAYKGGKEIGKMRIMSVGGGSIHVDGEKSQEMEEIYPQKNFSEYLQICQERGITLSEYAYSVEGDSLKSYLSQVWEAMQDCVERGLKAEGTLPGGLGITRKAKILYKKRCYNESSDITEDRLVAAYSYAVCEENADEHLVVTAPTCGSCGVIPSVLYYLSRHKGYPDDEIIDALATAGIVGNVIRTNASISGAECGCQAEVGSACSMLAAALASIYRLNLKQVEYAAEVAMEHHLGLTCDPIKGLVQIPCIERNAVAAMRAMNAVNLSRVLYETRRISLDEVIQTMYQTGRDLSEKYRETSHGGLAVLHQTDNILA